jgi:signal transduction histidine kinase/CheY-like chemotaxis protein
MKNLKIVLAIVFVFVLVGNLYFFASTYFTQLNFHKELLLKQVENLSNSFEKNGLAFENDINFILYSDNAVNIFSSGQEKGIVAKLEVFYAKYPFLITNITVLDDKQNVFSIYKDSKDNFLNDSYVARFQGQLLPKEKVIYSNTEQKYIMPVFKNNKLAGNIIVIIDLINYFKKTLEQSGVNEFQWPSVIDSNGNVLFAQKKSYEGYLNVVSDILAQLKTSNERAQSTEIEIGHPKLKYLCAYSGFQFLKSKYAVTINLKIHHIVRHYIAKGFFATLLNLSLLALIVLYYLKMVKSIGIEESKLRESEEAFKHIIEMMPIGIIIIDIHNRVKSLNKAATKILLIDENDNLIGEDISHRFFLGKSLLIDSEFSAAFETNHFLHYEKDGNDIVIFKKDIPLKLKGEDIIVQSFIDVTPIEKSRKREISANMAKSEFLAKMSHEIRTPMNGIIGMADSFSLNNLTAEQIEQVTIIKKSADLLLNIINDILDLSKIEVGKMVLEEIPFKINEEIKLAVELFKVSADEKNLKLKFNIAPDVPLFLIGDPFRLRQILINLIGNSIKFTQEGEIHVNVALVEEYDRNLTLKFTVEDTGIGIPKDKLQHIFQSFTQADNSTTRKFGGTGLGTAISKQLVELMNGEITVESPSEISKDPKFPGSKFSFTIELFSNEKLNKNINYNNIRSFNQIKTLIIGENKPEEKTIEETLAFFNVPSTQQTYQKSTIDFLKGNSIYEDENTYKLLVVKDSQTFDGFKLIARLNDAKITGLFTILLVSTNDKQGNYVKCKRNGIDYYLVFPYETSELYNFLCETFTSLQLEEEKAKFKVHQMKADLKILVAEDNFINQKVAKTLFKNIGYEIDFAKNGLEVIEMVKLQPYDIIFMDIMMPEMDGIQATIELRKQKIDIPIIAMTANVAKDEKNNAIASGMNDYITKPVRMDTIKKIFIKLFSEEV